MVDASGRLRSRAGYLRLAGLGGRGRIAGVVVGATHGGRSSVSSRRGQRNCPQRVPRSRVSRLGWGSMRKLKRVGFGGDGGWAEAALSVVSQVSVWPASTGQDRKEEARGSYAKLSGQDGLTLGFHR